MPKIVLVPDGRISRLLAEYARVVVLALAVLPVSRVDLAQLQVDPQLLLHLALRQTKCTTCYS